MKKTNRIKLFGLIALVAVFGFSMAGCGGGAGDGDDNPGNGTIPQTAQYLSADSEGNLYTLTITEDADNRSSRYTAQSGDTYELTTGIKISRGIVSIDSSGNLVLTPVSGIFTVTVTISGGNLTSITGTITWDDGDTTTAPGDVTPFTSGEADPSLNGTWVRYQEMVVEVPGHDPVVIATTSTFTYNNGNYNTQRLLTGNTFRDAYKGTYFTGNDIMACTATHIHGDTLLSIFSSYGANFESRWYAQNEKTAVKNIVENAVRTYGNNNNLGEDGINTLLSSFLSNVDTLFSQLGLTSGGKYEVDGDYFKAFDAELRYSVTCKKHSGGTITIHDNHDWDDNWTTLLPATATEIGVEGRYCKSDPSHMQIRTIPATGG